MKILELRFKNLNSLYGSWFIDFTDPEYTSNGIFALTGPTGAGKSTILDAICLALYGATPRLGKITKSGNEIISRQTGECFAEVLFESQEGRFRCHWSQHRARKKASGELQNPRHEISWGIEEGKVIENQIRRVASVIEEKTGMDFERFTRSILLAQGGFDTFLKADVEQKSKILEQITGTEIYSAISQRVHERQRDERDRLNLLKAETSGIVVLEPEEEKAIQLDLEGRQKQETELAARTAETGKSIDWLHEIDGLKKEIGSLTEESTILHIEIEAFKPDRERLSRGLKAAELDGAYATLTAVRKQQTDDQASLKTEQEKLPELESSFSQQSETLKTAEQKTIKAKEELRQATPLIRDVRSLDQTLTDQKKDVTAREKDCKKDTAKIASDKRLKLKEQEKRVKASSKLERVEQYLREHSQDEWLVTGLAGVEEQLGNLLSKQRDIAQKTNEEQEARNIIKQSCEKLNTCTNESGVRKQKLEDAVKNLEQGKMDLSALLGDLSLREHRTEKETLLREMAYLRKIEELEDYRAKLEDGKPCPLCGAEGHPYAEGNVPEADETEKKIKTLSKLIRKAEEQESAIKNLEKAETKARKNLAESEKLETDAANVKKAAEKSLSLLTGGLSDARAGFAELKNAVLTKLWPLGVEEIPDSGVSSLLGSLQKRQKKWQDQVHKKAEAQKHILELDSELKRIDAIIETLSSALSEKQKALESVKKEYTDGKDRRRDMYRDKNPDDEEILLNKGIADAESAERRTRKLREDAKQKLTFTRTNVASLKERIEKRVSELITLTSDFEASSRSTGFTDEENFLEARLGAVERDRLAARAKKLDDGRTDLKARQKDREDRLSTEIARKLTEKTLEELNPQFQELEENLKQIKDTVAGLKHKLTENAVARERIKEKQTLIDAQDKECQRWENLHTLIGSADGKKYRNFAQGLTFELMVKHANRQLVKMTDRYELIRNDEQPLKLNVVDNYQAGEIRSTQNLSGGESFIVSLTLALGLSKMASQKVRVDSLFLDEGFGTLDEEALETALETLAGLQQDGKLIGIISHVSALKERIRTQINVLPVSGGKSAIAGPGCHHTAESPPKRKLRRAPGEIEDRKTAARRV